MQHSTNSMLTMVEKRCNGLGVPARECKCSMVCFAGQVLQYNTLTGNARKVFAVMFVKFPDATMAADSTGGKGCPSCLGNIQGQTFKTKQKDT